MKALRLVTTALVVFAMVLASWTPWDPGWGEAQARRGIHPIRGVILYGVGRAGRTVIRKQVVGGTVRQAERIVGRRIERKIAAKAAAKAQRESYAKVIDISRKRFREAADHIADAQAAGHPKILTPDRLLAEPRRRKALKNVPTMKRMDRDEYPGSMFKEGGLGASVRHIPSSVNRACGAYIGRQCAGIADGIRVLMRIVE